MHALKLCLVNSDDRKTGLKSNLLRCCVHEYIEDGLEESSEPPKMGSVVQHRFLHHWDEKTDLRLATSLIINYFRLSR